MDLLVVIQDYATNFSQRLYQLQQKGEFCDMWLECKDGEIPVHSLVFMVGQSSLFMKLLSGREAPKVIKLQEFSVTSVEDMVKGLYTGRFPLNYSRVEELVKLSLFLGLSDFTLSLKTLIGKSSPVKQPAIPIGENNKDQMNQEKEPCSPLKQDQKGGNSSQQTNFSSPKSKNVTPSNRLEEKTVSISQAEDKQGHGSPQKSEEKPHRGSPVRFTNLKDVNESKSNVCGQQSSPQVNVITQNVKVVQNEIEKFIDSINDDDKSSDESEVSESHEGVSIHDNVDDESEEDNIVSDINSEDETESPRKRSNSKQGPSANKKKKTDSEDNNKTEESTGSAEKPTTRSKKGAGESKEASEGRSCICLICQDKFTSAAQLQEHLKEHTGNRPFKCADCGKRFSTKHRYQTHRMVHTGERPYMCDTCGKGFTASDNFKKHVRLHSGDKPFKCDDCGKCFAQKIHLTVHITRAHTNNRPYICQTCGKRFVAKNELSVHMRTHSGYKPFMCTICGKTFSQRGNLAVHMHVHTGEKPHECGECGRTFKSIAQMKSHCLTHTDQKPFCCEECGKTFRNSQSLKLHIAVNHSRQSPYYCHSCQKSFASSGSLTRHFRRVHAKSAV